MGWTQFILMPPNLCLSQGDRMPVPLPAHWGQQEIKIQFIPSGTLDQGGPISGSSQVSRKYSKRGPVLTINLLPWALSFSTQAGHCNPVGDRMLPPILCTGNHSSHHALPCWPPPRAELSSWGLCTARHPAAETPSSPRLLDSLAQAMPCGQTMIAGASLLEGMCSRG